MHDAARHLLLRQHDSLRMLLREAVREARRVCAGAPDAPAAFEVTLAALRQEIAAHNLTEESLLRPVLAAQARPGVLRARRMDEAHAAEHALIERQLAQAPPVVAQGMDGLAEELDAHMLAEERTFLSLTVFSPTPAHD